MSIFKIIQKYPDLIELTKSISTNIQNDSGDIHLLNESYEFFLEGDMRDHSVISFLFKTGSKLTTIERTPIALVFEFIEIDYKIAERYISLNEKLKIELQNISLLHSKLINFDEAKWRDLHFFIEGYNKGYTRNFS